MTKTEKIQQSQNYKQILGCVLTSSHLNLMDALYRKDSYTFEHCQRVSYYCFMIGKTLNLTKEKLELLILGALLHDAGKITIPDNVLKKPGVLSGNEWEIMQAHSRESVWLIHAAGCPNASVLAALHHHERYDGTGYPHGLKGQNIPLLSRIMSVADAYDAMTTKRCYNNVVGKEDALDRLFSCKGSQFDPEIADAFVGVMREPQTYFQTA